MSNNVSNMYELELVEVLVQAHEQKSDIIFYNNIDLVNKILKSYPDKNLYFMAGPLGIGFKGTLTAKSRRSSYDFGSVINFDDVICSLKEVIDYCGDDDIFLYSFGIIFASNVPPICNIRFANENNNEKV